MSNQQERAELHKTIWKIANDLRGLRLYLLSFYLREHLRLYPSIDEGGGTTRL